VADRWLAMAPGRAGRKLAWLCVLLACSWLALCLRDAMAQSTGEASGRSAPPPEELIDLDQLPNAQRSMRRIGAFSDQEAARRGFKLTLHEALAKGTVGRTCSNLLVRAQWNQDVVHFFDSKAHFDNCAFGPSVTYVQSLLAEAGRAADRRDRDATLSTLGQVLHAIQDFYAHSNYVELSAASVSRFDQVTPVRVWEPGAQEKVADQVRRGLVSGVWSFSSPQQCLAGARTHDELAKDGPSTDAGQESIAQWNMTAFQAAYRLADLSSAEFLGSAFRKWPFLEEACGPVLGYAVFVDRR